MSLQDGTPENPKLLGRLKKFFGLDIYEEKDMNWFYYGLVLFLWPFHWLVCFWVVFCFLIGCAPLGLLDWCLDRLIKKTKENSRLLWLRKCCQIVKVEITSVLDFLK